jgi:hypothetical protein
MAPKAPPKFTSPAKPPETSTMTQDEIQEIYHQMEKRITENRKQMEHKMDETIKINMVEMENNMDKKMNENSAHMEYKLDKKMDDMKNKMDENKEEIQKTMKELQNYLSSMIFHVLDERISKGDIKMQGNQENKGSIMVEQLVGNKQISSGFKFNSGVNYIGDLKFNFPKIELKKFDGK